MPSQSSSIPSQVASSAVFEGGAEVQDHARRYLRVSGDQIAWDLIRWAYQSNSRLAVIPAQDLLSLGADARMNEPGMEQGNWQWRMDGAQFNSVRQSAPYLRELADLYGRDS